MGFTGKFIRSEPPPLRLARALEGPRRHKSSYPLAWSITLTLMLVLAVASWVFSIYVFQHPEEPIPHLILRKLNRLEPPQRFDIYAVPAGKALPARDAYAKYRRFLGLSPAELEALNSRLIREYLNNYRRADAVDYVSGTFRVISVVPLHEGSFLPNGVAVRAAAVDTEDLEIEYLMPGPSLRPGLFREGDELVIEASRAFAAVVQASPLPGQRICLSLIPLVYGPHTPPEGDPVELEPPPLTNPSAPWPASDHPPA